MMETNATLPRISSRLCLTKHIDPLESDPTITSKKRQASLFSNCEKIKCDLFLASLYSRGLKTDDVIDNLVGRRTRDSSESSEWDESTGAIQ
ncbi:hypothetical protein KIN20_016534, partial [Parelaphostrongylus tenuis]